jgi:proton glutamate symport protein
LSKTGSMPRYKDLSFPVRLIIVILLTVLAAGILYVHSKIPDNDYVTLLSFLISLLDLAAIFNLRDYKIYTKIFFGLGLGAVAGMLAGTSLELFYPLGRIFIALIKMIVVPLVFASLLVGTAGISDLKKLGRIGTRTLVFYLLSTVLAVSVGLFFANVLKPGSDITPEVQTQLMQNYRQEATGKISLSAGKSSLVEMLVNIVPENPLRALGEANMLQIIFLALIAGIALNHLTGEKKQVLLRFFEGINDLSIRLVQIIMKMAPYGVFALISYVIGRYGSGIIFTLLNYFLVTLLALAVHQFLFNSAVIRFLTTLKLKEFWRGIYPALLVSFSTSSSNATLPVSIECAEKNLEVKSEIASFVLPLGATINMNGTAIYQGVTAFFIAAVYGLHLTFTDQLTIITTATLAAIGTAGAPQVGVLMLTMVLQSAGIPLQGIALILGVERFLDMARTVVNITGDLSCACYIDYKER